MGIKVDLTQFNAINMKNKILLIIIIILLVVIIILLLPILKHKNETVNAPAIDSSETPAENPSEQLNLAKFNEYFFAPITLGKSPIGVRQAPQETTVFDFSKDQFCISMNVKKDIPAGSFSSAIYNPASKKYVQPQMVFPMELKLGGFGGCGNGPQVSAGNYENRIYIDNVLVAILPFEVK